MALHPDTKRDALRRVPFLSRFDDKGLDAVGGVLRPRRWSAEEVVYRQGDSGDALLVVVEGRLAVHVRADSGGDVEVASVLPGEIVGEMACVDPGPRAATVVASEETRALELDRNLLQSLIKYAPEMASAWLSSILELLAKRVQETHARVEAELARRGLTMAPNEPGPPAARPPMFDEAGRIDLRSVPCLKPFTREELATFVKAAPARRLPAGTELCRENVRSVGCFIVAAGTCDVVRTVGGQERIIAMLPHGSLVEPLALVDSTPHTVTVRLRTDGVVMPLARRDFQKLVAAVEPFAVKLLEQLAISAVRQLRTTTRQLARVTRHDPPAAPRSAQPPTSAPWRPEDLPTTVVDRVHVVTPPPRRPSFDAPTIPPIRPEDLPPHIRVHVREANARAVGGVLTGPHAPWGSAAGPSGRVQASTGPQTPPSGERLRASTGPQAPPGERIRATNAPQPPPERLRTPTAPQPPPRARPAVDAVTPPPVAVGSNARNEDEQLSDVFAYLSKSAKSWGVSIDDVKVAPNATGNAPRTSPHER